MSFIEIIKCIFERLIVVLILLIIFAIGKSLFHIIIDGFIRFLPNNSSYIVSDIFDSIYNIFAIVLGLFIFLYIFKIRYLDYYDFVKESDLKEEDKKEEKDDKKIMNAKKEKIVIRDPKHSSYRFFSTVAKVILFFVKLFISWIIICGLFTLVSLVSALVVSFLFIKTGLMFIGVILILISLIVINIMVVNVLYNFVISKKSKLKRLFIVLISSTLVFGLGLGLCFIALKDFDVYEGKLNTMTKEIAMKDDLYIDNYYVIFKETNSNNIKIVVNYSDYYNVDIYNEDNYITVAINNISKMHTMDIIRKQIEDINSKRIDHNAGYYSIEVHTSKENIKKLQDNKNEHEGYMVYGDDE